MVVVSADYVSHEAIRGELGESFGGVIATGEVDGFTGGFFPTAGAEVGYEVFARADKSNGAVLHFVRIGMSTYGAFYLVEGGCGCFLGNFLGHVRGFEGAFGSHVESPIVADVLDYSKRIGWSQVVAEKSFRMPVVRSLHPTLTPESSR